VESRWRAGLVGWPVLAREVELPPLLAREVELPPLLAREVELPPPLAREVELPPPDVAPGAELEADPPVDANRLEAERLVQPDAGVVGQRHARARDAQALLGQQAEERLVQCAAG